MGAKLIPVIPKLLDTQFINQNYNFKKKPYSIVCGLDYENVSAQIFDFTTLGLLSICGRENSGKSNFVRYALSEINKNKHFPLETVIIDDITRKFQDQSGNVSRYAIFADDITNIISKWHEKLKIRHEMLISGNGEFEKEPLLLMIIQNNDVHEIISKDKETLVKYKEILGKYKGMKICIIYSNIENAQISFSSPDTLKMIHIDSVKTID